jgi:disulfide bond formation protein DsbB
MPPFASRGHAGPAPVRDRTSPTMTTSTLSLFFALLSLATLVVALVAAVLRFGARGARWEGWRRDLGRVALPLAWVIATVTTLGSLYYSEVADYVPCALCWYQRIAMYPLALLLGIATFRHDLSVRLYVIAQCTVGAVIASYHAWIQAFPPEGGSSFCTVEASCTIRYVWELGFVSLPFMALSAFLGIIALLLVAVPTGPAATDQGGRP